MTAQEQKHIVVTPWVATKAGIYDANGLCVAKRHPQAESEWADNARFIVKACNAMAKMEDNQ